MPEGLAAAMTPDERRDLVRFLLDLGRPGPAAAGHLLAPRPRAGRRSPTTATPLQPEHWPNWQHPVNRDRRLRLLRQGGRVLLEAADGPGACCRSIPGSTAGSSATGATRTTTTWADGRWNQTDLGTLLCGVFRGAGVTVPKGVCVRLGDRGELSACFNPETLCYEAVWSGGFVRFSPDAPRLHRRPDPGRHPAAPPRGQEARTQPFVYHGFYRHGKRVIFAYRIGDVEMLDAPWVEDGRFTRIVAPAAEHPARPPDARRRPAADGRRS